MADKKGPDCMGRLGRSRAGQSGCPFRPPSGNGRAFPFGISDTLESFADLEYLSTLHLIEPVWTGGNLPGTLSSNVSAAYPPVSGWPETTAACVMPSGETPNGSS
jgi:hypothetical protein